MSFLIRIRVAWHALRGRPTISNCHFAYVPDATVALAGDSLDVMVVNCRFDTAVEAPAR